jgi:hypothetical protein
MGKRWLVAIGATGAALAARSAWRNWGATADERLMALPGDELVPEPASTTTQAVTVLAPPSEVWRWLVQIGQDRGGLYSYDWMDNLIGLRIHSADEVRDEWQHLAVGDRVRLIPPGWMGLADGYSLPVAHVEPERSIVLRQEPPEHPWNAIWSFTILPDPDWPDRCRLVSRSRDEQRPGLGAAMQRALTAAFDPITLVMTRRMLLGIKERAESEPVTTWQGRQVR